MSEEEKEAIENLKSWREYIINHKEDVIMPNEIEFYLRTVLNLIENYKNLIEDVSHIAKELKLEEDGTIDEILIKIKQQQKEIEEQKERLSIRKEQQNSILTEKIKILREEKIELIHNFEEKEKISKKEIKSLLKEIEDLKNGNIDFWISDKEIEKKDKKQIH